MKFSHSRKFKLAKIKTIKEKHEDLLSSNNLFLFFLFSIKHGGFNTSVIQFVENASYAILFILLLTLTATSIFSAQYLFIYYSSTSL